MKKSFSIHSKKNPLPAQAILYTRNSVPDIPCVGEKICKNFAPPLPLFDLVHVLHILVRCTGGTCTHEPHVT